MFDNTDRILKWIVNRSFIESILLDRIGTGGSYAIVRRWYISRSKIKVRYDSR